MRFLAGSSLCLFLVAALIAGPVFLLDGERLRLPVPPTAILEDESGALLIEAGPAFYRAADAERVPASVALSGEPPAQTPGGSLSQISGDGQSVVSGSRFDISVRARDTIGAPTAGLRVAVVQVRPAGNTVVCLPAVTGIGGQASLSCIARARAFISSWATPWP